MDVTDLAFAVFCLAALPAAMTLINLFYYRPLPAAVGPVPAVSVLIPARNEAQRIRPVLRAVLASRDSPLEVIVADDGSTDETAPIVQRMAESDPRLRLIQVPPLPAGWIGKNHALHVLSLEAQHEHAIFIDADVVIAPDTVHRVSHYLAANPTTALISGFPRQITGSLGERLLIPLIHVLLLGYLPLPGMVYTRRPAFATGCGQLIAVRLSAYRRAGGHAAIRQRIHDGIALPRLFRGDGFQTALFDATDAAATRMYDNWSDLLRGLMKNAHEGLATPIGLPIWTLLLFGGHVMPFLLLLVAVFVEVPKESLMWIAASVLVLLGLRLVLALRFSQPLLGVLLQPFAMSLLLAIQWTVLIKRCFGWRGVWKDRRYA